jgi:peptide/nickel transport system ATP-binding protein
MVETGSVRDIIREPKHPYTKGLLAANLHGAVKGSRLQAIPGAPPPLEEAPRLCPFSPRCPARMAICEAEPAPLKALAAGRSFRCHL